MAKAKKKTEVTQEKSKAAIVAYKGLIKPSPAGDFSSRLENPIHTPNHQ